MNLYQITQSLNEALDNAFDPETGEALPEFLKLRELWDFKTLDIMAYALNIKADALQLDELIKKLRARKIAKENQHERLISYLRENMKASGISKLTAHDGSFVAKLFVGIDESVELDSDIDFPLELCNPVKKPEPSKTLIKAAILRGEPVAGARIVKKDRLVIK